MNEFGKMNVGISILAGGLGSRMGGVDKARQRLGRRTLLGHVRAAAADLGGRVRVISKDAVERCGPLGGIVTALRSSRRSAEVFLACDMPFVRVELLRRLIRESKGGRWALFASDGRRIGFPCLIPVGRLPDVERCIQMGELSLRELCAVLRGKRMAVRHEEAWWLFNVNTVEALEEARRMWVIRRGC